mgnify:CR=1 FL=1
MDIFYKYSNICKYRYPVVALGVFDGVHVGHRKIIKSAVKEAKQNNGQCIVVTFWPHPQGQESLYSLQHRQKIFSELGVDVCLVIRFTKSFSKIYAEDFVRRVLVDGLKAKTVYIGRNFSFGKGAKGNSILLKTLGKKFGICVRVFKLACMYNNIISSTCIRRLISDGKLSQASAMLGRPVSVMGKVMRGKGLGRKLGFATANIHPHHEVVPNPGVYLTETIFNGNKLPSVCFVGKKFSFVEAHILNFHKNLYGKILEVQFLKKIRNEKKFPDHQSLSQQIRKDVAKASAYFSKH